MVAQQVTFTTEPAKYLSGEGPQKQSQGNREIGARIAVYSVGYGYSERNQIAERQRLVKAAVQPHSWLFRFLLPYPRRHYIRVPPFWTPTFRFIILAASLAYSGFFLPWERPYRLNQISRTFGSGQSAELIHLGGTMPLQSRKRHLPRGGYTLGSPPSKRLLPDQLTMMGNVRKEGGHNTGNKAAWSAKVSVSSWKATDIQRGPRACAIGTLRRPLTHPFIFICQSRGSGYRRRRAAPYPHNTN
ncbi:hypothetical protein K440DRAFT_663617 [Wilcoxina mikolae CBS 423.85]|nr:hypothetical protein K440DRAFT_663617 [Wilcoxina mikolae CBS 423.85]